MAESRRSHNNNGGDEGSHSGLFPSMDLDEYNRPPWNRQGPNEAVPPPIPLPVMEAETLPSSIHSSINIPAHALQDPCLSGSDQFGDAEGEGHLPQRHQHQSSASSDLCGVHRSHHQQQHEDQAHQGLDDTIKRSLEESELDEAYWTSVFKRVGFTKSSHVKYLRQGSEAHEDLRKAARNSIEKNILHDFIESFTSKELQQDQPNQNVSVQSMLEKIKLEKYYPGKISLQDVMCLHQSDTRRTHDIKNLPWIILEKIIMSDYTARDDEIGKFIDTSDSFNEDDQCVDDVIGYHPLDVFLVTFQCCDLILQQVLVKKMIQCQIAVPFIIPGNHLTCCLWSLKAVAPVWKDSQGATHEESLTSNPIHKVSFVKLGSPSFSKSKLLNEVIEQKAHDTFCHWDSAGGRNLRSIANGFIEAGLYLPSGSASDAFPDAILFFNLRGDAHHHQSQMQVLKKLSTSLVVLIEAEQIEYFMSELQSVISKNTVVLLTTKMDQPNRSPSLRNSHKICKDMMAAAQCEQNLIVAFTSQRKKSAIELAPELQSKINEVIRHSSVQCAALESQCTAIAHDAGFNIDEQSLFSSRSVKKLVSETCKNKQLFVGKEIKTTVPLQGILWQERARLDKELHRTKKADDDTPLHELQDDIHEQMEKFRQTQMQCSQKLSHVMQNFTDALKQTIEIRLDAVYFMQSIRIELDCLSRNILRDEFSAIGVEHLLRELGQMYEASPMTYSSLPRIAAKLLLYGVPFEVLDGDAASIPVAWVKAVFTSLKNILGNKRLFVVSVIGIQSSGKSTLLNTMFGLEFPVSAGRCTRGVYAQLLSTSKSNWSLPFDYTVVLDTEGLRDPKQRSAELSHDNELATFVIGMADLTLINLKGENIGEMRDILQIAVHAFLRMKVVDSTHKRRCMFVHQNVTAVDAGKKLEDNLHNLQENLDQLTKEAAQAENVTHEHLQCFSGVIGFNGSKDVRYFSDLWKGDPPTAHVNPGYSLRAKELKSTILKQVKDERPILLRISDFITRIEDMWSAILSDEFVFSFKNSLVIKAHLLLESKVAKLRYEMKENIWSEIRKTEMVLRACDNLQDLDSLTDDAIANIRDKAGEITDVIRARLDEFFNNTLDYKDILAGFREQRKESLKSFATTELARVERRLLDQQKYHYHDLMHMERVEDHKPTFMKNAFTVATQLGKASSNHTIEEKFYQIWTSCVEPEPKRISTEMVRNRMEIVLIRELMMENRSVDFILLIVRSFHATSENLMKGISIDDITKDLFKIKQKGTVRRAFDSLLSWNNGDCEEIKVRKEIAKNVNKSLIDMNVSLQVLSSRDYKFFYIHCEEFVKDCMKQFDIWNANPMDKKFIITPTLKAKFVSHAVNCAINEYCKRFSQVLHASSINESLKIKRQLEEILLNEFNIEGHESDVRNFLVDLYAEDIPLSTRLVNSVTKDQLKDTFIQFNPGYEQFRLNNYQGNVLESVNDIMHILDNKLENICNDGSRFFSTHGIQFVKELLDTFASFNQQKSKMFSFTWDCRAYLSVFVCRHAALRFEAMNIKYDIRYGRRAQLEVYKEQAKTLFRNQVKHIETSDTFAEILCSVIKRQLEKLIVTEMTKKINNRALESVEHSKTHLIQEVLTDLAKKEDIKLFMRYLFDAFELTSSWLKEYIENLAFKDVDEYGEVLYSKLVIQQIDRLFDVIHNAIKSASVASFLPNSAESKKSLWIQKFCGTICKRSDFNITEKDFQAMKHLQVTDISLLTKVLDEHLKQLQESVTSKFCNIDETSVVWDGESPEAHVMRHVWGCKEQCPFCNEPCKRSKPDHSSPHQCVLHRPRAVCGHADDIRKPLMETCSAYIGSSYSYTCTSEKCGCRTRIDRKKERMERRKHDYKSYKKYHKKWDIPSNVSRYPNQYWLWFLYTFKDDLTRNYMFQFSTMPYYASQITKDVAIESLSAYQHP